MAAHAARRLLAMAENAANVVGIELLAAVQGCDFHAPMTSSPRLERARACLRNEVPRLEDDRHFSPDMVAATRLVASGRLVAAVGAEMLPCVDIRSEEHTSELQSLMRISYAVFCLTKKNHTKHPQQP